eukprot:14377299-Heterocapsa_arctica.AAC.1
MTACGHSGRLHNVGFSLACIIAAQGENPSFVQSGRLTTSSPTFARVATAAGQRSSDVRGGHTALRH